MKDKVGETVRASREAWLKHRKALTELKQAADLYPVSASIEFDYVAELLRRKAVKDFYYFTVVSPQARYLHDLETGKIELTEPHNLSTGEVNSSQPYTLDFDEEVGATLAGLQYATYKRARIDMTIAGEESYATGNGFYGPAVCEAFLKATDEVPAVFAGAFQEKLGGDPRIREAALSSLAGWVGARINLAPNRRHTQALNEQPGAKALDQLAQALPAAVVIEWAALSREESPAVLVRGVERQIEEQGSQAAKLHRKGKLAEGQAELTTESTENDLEEFERKETLQQELNTLKGWVEKAGFSEDEARVYELDMQTDHNTKLIAQKLGKASSTVRQHRKRYRDKLRKVSNDAAL